MVAPTMEDFIMTMKLMQQIWMPLTIVCGMHRVNTVSGMAIILHMPE
jgi:hypothetical protein